VPSFRIPPSWEIPERLVTPEPVFWSRRQVLAALGLGAAAASLPLPLACSAPARDAAGRDVSGRMLEPATGARYARLFPARKNPAYPAGGRTITPADRAGGWNNFYEFSSTKDAVWKLAVGYPAAPWALEIGGLVAKPLTLDLDGLMKRFPLEERIYRFRCVERWAMVVPWTGFPLRRLIDLAQPLGSARFVRFVSFRDPERCPGMKETLAYYPWPYHEGLRLDEARHDLAFVAVGMYGRPLPMQNGAPLRLALPWKYGYKGPKSVVRLELTAEQPPTFWNALEPAEYGFYSNVNPQKPHPRWSQAIEKDIGTMQEQPTIRYNGYAREVAGLYSGEEI